MVLVASSEAFPAAQLRTIGDRLFPQRLDTQPIVSSPLDMLHPTSPDFLRPGAQDILRELEAIHNGRYISPAREYVEDDGALFVRNGTREYARDYWLRLGIDRDAINKMVDEAGRVIPTPDDANPYFMHPLDAGMWVVEEADGFYDHNAKPLHDGLFYDTKGAAIDGMNMHKKPHVRTVVRGAFDILQQMQRFRSDLTVEDFLEATIGAGIHDMGNILNRKLHSKISPLLAGLRMPILMYNERLWQKIQRVAIFHNEPEIRNVIDEVWHTKGDASQTIKRMQVDFSPALLAVILADKLHLGQDRLPDVWTDRDGLFRDWQIAVNAFFGIRDAGYTEDGKKFTVNIDYNPGPQSAFLTDVHGSDVIKDDSTKYEYGAFPQHQAIHRYLEQGIASHSEVLEAMFWSKDGYRERMRLIIMSAFALNPKTQEVEINIHDELARAGLTAQAGKEFHDDRGKIINDNDRIAEIEHRTYTFTRENIDDQLKAIEQKFLDKGIKLTELLEARDRARNEAKAQSTTRRSAAMAPAALAAA